MPIATIGFHENRWNSGTDQVSIYGHKLYIITYNAIVVFDAKSNTAVKRVPVANVLTSDALTPDGKYLYVTYSDKVSTIETATDQLIGSPVQVGQAASSVAVAPNGLYAYVTNEIDGTVSVIDISTQ